MKKAVAILVLILIGSVAYASDFDFSLTGSTGYARGTWGNGSLQSPTGTMINSVPVYGGALQIIYNGWKWKPTGELSFSYGKFDFTTLQAPTQSARQYIYSGMAGITKDVGRNASIYGLIGFSWGHVDARLTEIIDGKAYRHGTGAVKMDERGLSLKFGAYKSFWISRFLVGLEISLEIFPKPLGFSRCRKFDSGHFVPRVGLRIQY